MISPFIAALPLYDWPEERQAVDAKWRLIREGLRERGIDAPESLTRRNGDMPAVPGGIVDQHGVTIAPDPATLPPDDLDLATLWRHPALIFAQTCWGPLEMGLLPHVALIGAPADVDVEGTAGPTYSSAIVMRRAEDPGVARPAPADGRAAIPFDLLHGQRLAFNEPDSMSGALALRRDIEAAGATLSLFAAQLETGAHRASIRAIAEGRADVAAIDARSWHLALRHESCARALVVVGWTARRNGPPLIAARSLAGLHGTPARAAE